MPIQQRFHVRLERERESAKNLHDPFVWMQPVDGNYQLWHFTIRGPDGSPFEGGVYHGVVTLSDEYPIRPPKFHFLTENGRYQVNTKICLSISDYHPEQWSAVTTIETMVRMIQTFLEDYSNNAKGIGFIPRNDANIKRLAAASVNYSCPQCGKIIDHLAPHHKDH